MSTQFTCQTCIQPMDRTKSDATDQGLSGRGSNGNKGVFRIPQSSSITGISPSDCLVSYPGHMLGKSYSSAKMQSVYSAALDDWDTKTLRQIWRVALGVWNKLAQNNVLCHFYNLGKKTSSAGEFYLMLGKCCKTFHSTLCFLWLRYSVVFTCCLAFRFFCCFPFSHQVIFL